MVVEYIRYKIGGDRREAFLDAYRNAAVSLDQSLYCLGYELTQGLEEPENFILRIEWTSTKEHLNGFRKSAEFKSFFTNVKPFLNDIQEMKHYELTKVVST